MRVCVCCWRICFDYDLSMIDVYSQIMLYPDRFTGRTSLGVLGTQLETTIKLLHCHLSWFKFNRVPSWRVRRLRILYKSIWLTGFNVTQHILCFKIAYTVARTIKPANLGFHLGALLTLKVISLFRYNQLFFVLDSLFLDFLGIGFRSGLAEWFTCVLKEVTLV